MYSFEQTQMSVVDGKPNKTIILQPADDQWWVETSQHLQIVKLLRTNEDKVQHSTSGGTKFFYMGYETHSSVKNFFHTGKEMIINEKFANQRLKLSLAERLKALIELQK